MEVQDTEPDIKLPLEKIGFKGVKRRIKLNTPKGEIVLDLDLDVFISIDGSRRGAHLSRNIEALDLAGLLALGPARSIEEYLEAVSQKLLKLHNYASQVEARARTIYYTEIEYNGIQGVEPVNVEVAVVTRRDGSRTWVTSVTVAAMSVCPSAQISVSQLLKTDNLAPSHVQRVLITGRVTTRGEMARIEDIAHALLDSASAPVFTHLKRMQEARLVIEAHRRPMFAEDIARSALCNLAKRLKKKVSTDSILEVSVDSIESIHPHNVYAYARSVLGELLNEPSRCS
ncbi:MAG: GTP cyclohydrolase, FolE2/MptA family [Desulfurococcales archaeon]|nr:GTP cyclohydrolase, FolE2/MptA family [Desulfurococcales archaeon]